MMKFSFMSAAVAASVIWGASAGPLSETHAYSTVTAPVLMLMRHWTLCMI